MLARKVLRYQNNLAIGDRRNGDAFDFACLLVIVEAHGEVPGRDLHRHVDQHGFLGIAAAIVDPDHRGDGIEVGAQRLFRDRGG